MFEKMNLYNGIKNHFRYYHSLTLLSVCKNPKVRTATSTNCSKASGSRALLNHIDPIDDIKYFVFAKRARLYSSFVPIDDWRMDSGPVAAVTLK